MKAKYPSNMAVIDVNRSINEALRSYLDTAVSIRFDLPDPANLPAEPVVSVFLYDMYEDLGLRTGEARAYSAGVLLPGKVNVCCNYLITYWDGNYASGNDSLGGAPDNQTMRVMNEVMNALINNRSLPGIPGAYTRVIPPRDDLMSLSGFWQSLGNKPRLLLNYSATVPVSLTNKDDSIPEVEDTEVTLEHKIRGEAA
ncbi:Pvc16 family protein [Burkholderia ubonensis]|uniref:Pvc16 family protein n=1 Tax=Burkholderia ubonensis TaxID=101571 RepID=UPI0007522192|nr:Pvc16 family protein [Burkholderia ubonensis]KVN29743.1 hypothetical protein WJ64_14920 [Burkholderia ubonensis]